MKKISLVTFLLFTLFASAQWTTPDGNGNITNTNSGGVGIGSNGSNSTKLTIDDHVTNASDIPSHGRWGLFSYVHTTHTGTVNSKLWGAYLLSLNGSGTLTETIGVNALSGIGSGGSGTVTNAYGVFAGVQKAGGTITNGYGVYINNIGATNQYGLYQSGSDDKNYFAGNVGIGTASPQAGLEIKGSGTIGGAWNPASSFFKITDGSGSMLFDNNEIYTSGLLHIGSNSGDIIKFRNLTSNGVIERFIIKENGNVGIGTTSPSGKLHVNGETYIDNGWLRVKGQKGILFQDYGGGLYMTDDAWIRTYGNKNFYHNSGLMRTDGTFQVGPGGDRFIVKTSGNIGIGTSTPDSKLTVAGNIHSREVKVTVDAGADFVFKSDYSLPTLEEVQEFINQNGHLPEIASAKDMEENGIHLSEMNIKLLQKIEELTLYTIEQEKELKNHDKKFKQQEEENIKVLEKQNERIEKLEKIINELINKY